MWKSWPEISGILLKNPAHVIRENAEFFEDTRQDF